MDYKFITGDNLAITSPGWSEGTVLQDIYPDSSFVSGVENPQSMKMVPVIRDQKIYAKYIFEKRFEGGPGLVHGGILSTVLDEMMGYATVTHNLWCVTANLEVNYRSPCPVEEELFSGDEVHVESSGLFINLGQARAQTFFIPDKNYP